MLKLKYFVGTCLLVGSMAAVTWADGGETHGPGLMSPAPPPAECTADCPSTENTVPVPDATADATDDLINVLATWVIGSVL